MLGIDAPELHSRPGHPAKPHLARLASEELARLILDKCVRLEKDVEDVDRPGEHGRYLRYVWIPGLCVNIHMVKQGYARAYPYWPNVRHKQEIHDAQDSAKKLGLVIWAPEHSESE